MHDALAKFLGRWIERALRELPLRYSAPDLLKLFERKNELHRKLGKLHPDIETGDAACILVFECLRKCLWKRIPADELSKMEGSPLAADDRTILSIIEDAVRYLASIPRPTLILIPINSAEGLGEGYFDLSGGFSLLKTPSTTESFEGIPAYLRPLLAPSPVSLTAMLNMHANVPQGMYLGRTINGIPTFFAGRETFNRAFDDIKVWLGIGERLMHFAEIETARGFLSPREGPKAAYMIDISTGELTAFDLSNEDSLYLSKQKLSVENISGYHVGFNNAIAPFFTADDLSSAAAAYQWLIDSKMANSETTAFLYCCFGLEAALGDDTADESITRLLSERCAYLLGTTETQRNELRKNFKAIYVKRSRLVHGRDRRMPALGDDALQKARSLLARVAFDMWSKYQRQAAMDRKRDETKDH